MVAGIAPGGRARGVVDAESFRVRVGRPRPARVPAVGALGGDPQEPIALAADEDAGPRLLRGGRMIRSRRRAPWCSPAYVNGPPPRRPFTTSSESTSRSRRWPGRGISMPNAAYSGSYQPAPRPTSRRPPLSRSTVASAFASTDAGRSASSATSVPRRTRGTARASAASVTTGSKHLPADRVRRTSRGRGRGGPRARPNRRHPAPRPGRTRRSSRTAAATPPRPNSRTAEAPARYACGRGYPRRARGSVPGARRSRSDPTRPTRTLAACWSASSTCPKDATWTGSSRSPARADRRSSTCTRTPTITGRCSRSRARAATTRCRRRERSQPRWPSSARSSTTTGEHPRFGALDVVPFVALGGTRVEREQAADEARAFGAMVGRTSSRSRCSCTTTPIPSTAICPSARATALPPSPARLRARRTASAPRRDGRRRAPSARRVQLPARHAATSASPAAIAREVRETRRRPTRRARASASSSRTRSGPRCR